MAPQKFASVRYRTRPVALVPFRDDTSLVGLRYEQTVQAEPPIPIPARNPLRSPPSSASIRVSTTRPFSSFSSPDGATHGTIIIVPPPGTLVPPAEEHPALRPSRSPSLERRRAYDNWKRDSGLAPTTSSAATTIREEEPEEDPNQVLYDKIFELAGRAIVPPPISLQTAGLTSPAPRKRELGADDSSSTYSGDAANPGRCMSPPMSPSSFYSQQANSQLQDARPLTPPRSGSPPRKLAKTFSFRSGAHKKLRKRSVSEGSDSSAGDLASAAATQPPSPSPQGTPTKTKFLPWPWATPKPAKTTDLDFSPISISIPTDSLLDDDFYTQLNFSKRGSILFGSDPLFGIDGNMENGTQDTEATTVAVQSQAQPRLPRDADSSTAAANTVVSQTTPERTSLPQIRVLPADVENESQKVRSLYASGDGLRWEDGGSTSAAAGASLEPTPEAPSEENEDDPPTNEAFLAPESAMQRSASSLSSHDTNSARQPFELAGGIEDWEDVEGADVDRYGFISVRRPESRVGTPTEMKSSQFSPRRQRNVLIKRDPSGLRAPGRKVSARSLNTQASEMSAMSMRSTRSAFRQAGNLLPHNRDRRWMDEAGDMLTLTPGLSDIMEDPKTEKISEELKRKEWERSEKWRKMATVVKKGKDGEGMVFEFDTTNAKLIERTWKGIPDRWRAAAWYSFLATSAQSYKGSATEEQIIADFHRLQDESSSDDVQIDLDVPRTINRHIMFRRRYRGGQRLLFRVLHALSLYFPETGYVQGMAALAATLLCYFDEEKCFVMLVRMWQYRGLEALYRPGFAGLMAALQTFESKWLAGKDVAAKLTELNIDPTAYGTRWYLTLFNLSIPFPAQLRVWDVFMLLSSASPNTDATAAASTSSAPPSNLPTPAPSGGLDVLHATGAALIQALREVLLDSDFENAMKALTSWIPIKDEELLMKVTRAEWKLHQQPGKKRL